ncbi:MAG: shikimate kinase [Oscillospiraceae bacterium]|nr:shikimate kinase [Oscillospiraceae bacterium]
MKNIVLIGMPGAGKSTVGVVLAKAMHMRFLDTDLSVQERMGECLQDTINREGKEGFLKIENEVLSTIHVKNTVIATGGSVVYGKEAMAAMEDGGVLVYLQYTYPTIESRLTNLDVRGVAMGPGETLRQVYDDRIPRYEAAADVTIPCEGKEVDDIVAAIMEKTKGLL